MKKSLKLMVSTLCNRFFFFVFCVFVNELAYEKLKQPWLVWLSGLSTILQAKRLLVQFPVRARVWVVGQVPSRRRMRGNHTLLFLSLSFYHPSPLSKSK